MTCKLNFIIPAYNEAENISNVVYEIRKCFKDRIIIVDDGSKDNTYNLIPDDNNLIKIRNNKNMGKGFSIKKALQSTECDYVCFIDADVEGIAIHIERIVPILEEYDCIIFSPQIKGGGFGILRRYAQYIVYEMTGKSSSWCISGMRIIKKEIIENIKNKLDDRFGFEVSMTVEILKSNYRFLNIEADFNHRVTKRNFSGFYHRCLQFIDLLRYRLRVGK